MWFRARFVGRFHKGEKGTDRRPTNLDDRLRAERFSPRYSLLTFGVVRLQVRHGRVMSTSLKSHRRSTDESHG